MMTKTKTTVRWLIRRDLDDVMLIDRESFPDAYWTHDEFMQALREQNAIGSVAEQGRDIVGFMIYEVLHDRLNIVNFAVHSGHRHEGVGTAMVDKIKWKLASPHRHPTRNKITVSVAEQNVDAQLFFQRLGFRCDCIRPGFYNGQDAYHMEYKNG